MKILSQNNTRSGAYKTTISHAGSLPRWRMLGFAQSVHAGRGEHPVQYVSFSISKDGTDRDDDFVYFGVTNLLEETGVSLDKGDCVIVTGTIMSWKKQLADGTQRWCIELVAQTIEEAPAGCTQLPDKPEIRAEVVPAGSDFGEASPDDIAGYEEILAEGGVPF